MAMGTWRENGRSPSLSHEVRESGRRSRSPSLGIRRERSPGTDMEYDNWCATVRNLSRYIPPRLLDDAIMSQLCTELEEEARDVCDDGQACASALFYTLLKSLNKEVKKMIMMRLIIEFEPKSTCSTTSRGNILVYCTVTGVDNGGCTTLVRQPIVLLEFSVREATHPPVKLLQNVRHTYARFPGKYHLAAISVCTTT